MSVRVKIRFEEETRDGECEVELVAVPAIGELVSIGSLQGDHLQRFEVKQVIHFFLDGESGVELYCRKLDKRELASLRETRGLHII